MTPIDLIALALEEPEILLDTEPEILLDDLAPASIEPAGRAPETAIARLPLMDVLPADFPIPLLAAFIPNPALKVQADEASRYALSVDVRGAEGLQSADDALTVLRGAQKAITECFAQPVEIANDLHRRLTGIRGDWLKPGVAAVETVGRKVYVETQRLKALADEERRKAQAEADRIAREDARKRAAAAEQAKAPAAVVEQLKRQAETAKAAPVVTPESVAPPVLRGTSTVKAWTCTIAGTPRDAEQQPAMADLTDAQRAKVLDLMRAVLDGKAPLACFEIGWPYLKKRAKSDESTLAIPSIEAFDAGSTRAKGSRSK